MARHNRTRLGRVGRGTGVAGPVLKGAFWLVAVGLGGLAVVFGFARLGDHLRGEAVYQLSRDGLRLVKSPDWAAPSALADLDVAGELPERFSLLDPTLCERLARAYEKCIWVERVERIVKRDPRVPSSGPPLEVRLRFRRPIAFVQVAGRNGFYLVDTQGVRLPGVYQEPVLGDLRLLVITGCQASVPSPGDAWSDSSLQAGVHVAAAVEPIRQKFRLVTVDVSNVGGRRDPRDAEIALFTANHTRIKWGKAPTPQAALLQEKTLAEKVAYLDFVYDRLGGRVDGVLSYVDIPNEVVGRRATPVGHGLRS